MLTVKTQIKNTKIIPFCIFKLNFKKSNVALLEMGPEKVERERDTSAIPRSAPLKNSCPSTSTRKDLNKNFSFSDITPYLNCHPF